MQPPVTVDASMTRSRAAWLRSAVTTERCDRAVAEHAVRQVYLASGLPEPEHVLWMDSPLGGVYAGSLLHAAAPDWTGAPALAELSREVHIDLRFAYPHDPVLERDFTAPLTDRLGRLHAGVLGEVLTQDHHAWRVDSDPAAWRHPGPVPESVAFHRELPDLLPRFDRQLSNQLADLTGPGFVPGRAPDSLRWHQPTVGWVPVHRADDAVPVLAAVHSHQYALYAAQRWLIEACAAVWWWVSFERVAVLVDRPTSVRLNDAGRLHNGSGPAITFADGHAGWFLDGHRVQEHLIEDRERDALRVLAAPGRDQVELLAGEYGWHAIAEETGMAPVAGPVPDPAAPDETLRLYGTSAPVRAVFRGCERMLVRTFPDGRTSMLQVPATADDPLAAAAQVFDGTLRPESLAGIRADHAAWQRLQHRTGRCDRSAAEAAARRAAATFGLPTPTEVIWVESPPAALLAAQHLALGWHLAWHVYDRAGEYPASAAARDELLRATVPGHADAAADPVLSCCPADPEAEPGSGALALSAALLDSLTGLVHAVLAAQEGTRNRQLPERWTDSWRVCQDELLAQLRGPYGERLAGALRVLPRGPRGPVDRQQIVACDHELRWWLDELPGSQLGAELSWELGEQVRAAFDALPGLAVAPSRTGYDVMLPECDDRGVDAMASWSWESGSLLCDRHERAAAGLPPDPAVEAALELAGTCGNWWLIGSTALLLERPTVHERDASGELHCPDGPALAWADGYAEWYWHGTRVPGALIRGEWDVARVCTERDMAVQLCAVERLGWTALLDRCAMAARPVPDPHAAGHWVQLRELPEDLDELFDRPARLLVRTVNGPDGGARTATPVSAEHDDPVHAAADTVDVPLGRFRGGARLRARPDR